MLEIKNIKAGYSNIEILKDISFKVNKGESLTVIGKNGCGKSTLLKVLSGNLDFKGEILIDGVSIKKLKHRQIARKICMLSQSTQLYFNYTVYEIVKMGRYVHSKSRIFNNYTKEDEKIVLEALQIVDLADLKNKPVNTLSGGQVQRVFLAKIIAQDPEVLLLDEPTNNLDLPYQIEFINFLKQWGKEKNKTIIGVIHDINLAMELSENALLMDKGKIKMIGENKKVFTSKEFIDIYKIDTINFMANSLEKWVDINEKCKGGF